MMLLRTFLALLILSSSASLYAEGFGSKLKKLSGLTATSVTSLHSIRDSYRENGVKARQTWANKRLEFVGYVISVSNSPYGDVHVAIVDHLDDVRSGNVSTTLGSFQTKLTIAAAELTPGTKIKISGTFKDSGFVVGNILPFDNARWEVLPPDTAERTGQESLPADLVAHLNTPIAQIPITAKPSLKERAEYGNIALTAASSGDIATLKEAILAGGMPNMKEEGESATGLFRVIAHENLDVVAKTEAVEFLLARGFTPNTAIGYNTALHVACRNGYRDIVVLLVRAKVNVNADNLGQSPLKAATQAGHSEIVGILRQAGAK
jgi:hypothetical protein